MKSMVNWFEKSTAVIVGPQSSASSPPVSSPPVSSPPVSSPPVAGSSSPVISPSSSSSSTGACFW